MVLSFVSALAGEAVPRIIDGTQVPESTFPNVCQVTVMEPLGNFVEVSSSTGILIAPNFVITAAHSVRAALFGRLFTDPKNITVTIGGADHAVTKYFVHPSQQNGIIINHEGFLDISILQLSQPVTGITPAPIQRTPPVQGSQLTLVGFGLTGTGAKGFNPKNEQFPAKGSVETGTAPVEILTPTLIKWNFQPENPPISDTAPGDSGGPAFISTAGQNVLAGITSGGNNPTSAFGDQAFDTRVDIATNWIDTIINGTPDFDMLPVASPTGTAPNQSITFAASAGSSVISWDFGDGNTSPAGGGTVMHSFSAPGTYLVAASAMSSNGNVSTDSVTVTVGSFLNHAAGDIVTGMSMSKKSFSIPSPTGIDSKKSPKTSINFTFVHPDFTSATALDKAAIRILVANQELISFINNVEIFQGTNFKVNTKKGTLTFTSKLDSSAPVIADALGAPINGPAKIPITVSINGVLYSGTFTFLVSSKGTKVTGK
jgi:hypothetical protein